MFRYCINDVAKQRLRGKPVLWAPRKRLLLTGKLFYDGRIKMNQIKTGIAGFDWFLGGGLPSKVLLLTGVPGTGNEVFSRQIAFIQASQNKLVSYFTVDSNSDYVKEDMLSYGWDVNQLVKSGNWKFISLKDKKLVDTVVKEIEQNRIVVIDSVSELLLTHEIKDVTNLLIEMSLKNRGKSEFHMLLLTEGMQQNQTETTMEHYAECVIRFITTWTGDSRLRHILIKKLRGTTVPGKRLQYNLGKSGIVIETATRIN